MEAAERKPVEMGRMCGRATVLECPGSRSTANIPEIWRREGPTFIRCRSILLILPEDYCMNKLAST